MQRAIAVLLIGCGTVGGIAAVAGATPNDKVTICHATSSASNPYTVNTVDQSSVNEQNNQYLNGHGDHDDDIIPPFPGFPGRNWTPANQTTWSNGCDIAPSPTNPSPTNPPPTNPPPTNPPPTNPPPTDPPPTDPTTTTTIRAQVPSDASTTTTAAPAPTTTTTVPGIVSNGTPTTVTPGIVSSGTPSDPGTATLPVTGSSNLVMASIAFWSVVTGLILLRLTRRDDDELAELI